MSTIVSLLMLLSFFVAIIGLRLLLEWAIAKHLGPILRGSWLGLTVFVLICLGGGIFAASTALDGLTSGAIHCFGRRCGPLSFQRSGSPELYWLGVALWSALAAFFGWAALHGIKRFFDTRRGVP